MKLNRIEILNAIETENLQDIKTFQVFERNKLNENNPNHFVNSTNKNLKAGKKSIKKNTSNKKNGI
jgi:hypothetical protein